LINSRSRVLVPLQSRISVIEETITQLEHGLDHDTQALIEASVKGDGSSIRRLSMSVREAEGKINILFDELQILTDELQTKAREFEEKLEALKAADG
jgi:predicted  nucleic acid-binding Zn-ribbon protein